MMACVHWVVPKSAASEAETTVESGLVVRDGIMHAVLTENDVIEAGVRGTVDTRLGDAKHGNNPSTRYGIVVAEG